MHPKANHFSGVRVFAGTTGRKNPHPEPSKAKFRIFENQLKLRCQWDLIFTIVFSESPGNIKLLNQVRLLGKMAC